MESDYQIDCMNCLRAAANSTGSVELRGSTDLPAPINSQATDTSCADASTFCATHWSSMLPQGYGTARRRAESTYDADVLEFFRDLARVEKEYATALQRLSERVVRDPEAGCLEEKSRGSGWRGALGSKVNDRPIARSLQYATAQHAWAALQASLHAQAKAHQACCEDMRSSVIEPLKVGVKQERARRELFLAPADKRLEEVRRARARAALQATQYGTALCRFRKEATKSGAICPGSQEAALLFEAASSCTESVRGANEDTTLFEEEVSGCLRIRGVCHKTTPPLRCLERDPLVVSMETPAPPCSEGNLTVPAGAAAHAQCSARTRGAASRSSRCRPLCLRDDRIFYRRLATTGHSPPP